MRTTVPERGLAKMQTWAISDRGAVRQQNQDSYRVITPDDQRCVVLVCDGMGGAKAGNIASSMAADIFAAGIEQVPCEQWHLNSHALMKQCADAANRAVFDRAMEDPNCEGMGTTMVAAMVLEDQTYILNVGDSRAYVISEDGGVCRVTRDHSVVEDLVSRGEIPPEAARVHPQKNLITRAMGVSYEIKCDLYDLNLKESDYLLLCSDGLSNLMDDQEISYEVLHGGTQDTCCERLLQLAMDRGAPDNVTVVLLRKTK